MRLALSASILSLIWAPLTLAQSISLEQAMADPDWIGREPRRPYWADDSGAVYFYQKRLGQPQEDLYRVGLDGAETVQVTPGERAQESSPGGTLSADRRLKAYAREGDIYVRQMPDGNVRQLTRSAASEIPIQFSADNRKLIFSRADTLFVRNLDTGLEYQAAELLLSDYPSDEETDYLADQQLRLFDIIRLQQEREDAETTENDASRNADRARLALPYYLGENSEIMSSALSPNESWLLIALRDNDEREAGERGAMPNYVTASGYVENRDVRSRVGTTEFADQRLLLIDLTGHGIASMDLGGLPERDSRPLVEQLDIAAAQDDEEEEDGIGPRAVYFAGLRWSADGTRALVNAISRDNKDRWLVAIDVSQLQLEAAEQGDDKDPSLRQSLSLQSAQLKVIHHQHDPAWINRGFIAAQWLPDNESILFLSEQDGYGHLYLTGPGGTRQITKGEFEVREPALTRDGEQVYFRANATHPTIYEIYRVNLADGDMEQLTNLGGMTRFVLAPDEQRLLLLHSRARHPTELYVQDAQAGAAVTRLTHSVSEEFLAIDWTEPDFVEIPSSHIDAPIHSRVYTPTGDQGNPRPAVVFIHGAGYLQNAHRGWSSYFREFMFHNFLVQQGYVVLDMDYRASLGYGRDWRTAIYRQMGTPEVQDLADGVDWLVANRNVDRQRVCTYGGSYGGFLTLMALFNEPDLFACGAALRPVTDWAHYNHGYTSNILNIPSLDPQAYERSSPIEFADGLQKPLLIAHGMQDDNVFFQDSVRLVQRLIELGKENWEMAIYPVEPHGFREPSSWLDEYRRIYKLVEQTLQ